MSREERPRSAYGEGHGTTRAEMDAAIKAIVVPHMRALGFKGSLPHLFRLRGRAVDVCSFWFYSSGGCFALEIAPIAPDGFDFYGKTIPPAKAKTSYTRDRHRLGASLPPEPPRDSWYVFVDCDPAQVAREVCEDLDRPEVWAFVDTLPVLGIDY